ncbi:MAG: prepilin-type N-terminal cleavage/methylation domain-containing protein [Planctomycetota bacterium]
MQRARSQAGVSAGFTLVELMVVIVIIGLIGGVAATSWVSMLPNQQFNSAIRNLSETLHETRSAAIARNREFRIRYDLDEDTYVVRTPYKLGGGFMTTDEDEDRLFQSPVDLGEAGIDLVEIRLDEQLYTSGKVEVYFQPLGVSNYHTVQLAQPLLEREFTLELLPLTGEIRLHDGIFQRPPVDEGDFK